MIDNTSLYKKYEKDFKIGAAINYKTMYSAEKLYINILIV